MHDINQTIKEVNRAEYKGTWDTVAVIDELYLDGEVPLTKLEVDKDTTWRRKYSEKWGSSYFFDEMKPES